MCGDAAAPECIYEIVEVQKPPYVAGSLLYVAGTMLPES